MAAWFLSLSVVSNVFALEAYELIVVCNSNVACSTSLARYYREARNIPDDQIVELHLTDKERCSRQEYEEKVAAPIRKYLLQKDPHGLLIRCIVLIYGIPLEVSPPEPDLHEIEEIKSLSEKIKSLQNQIRQSKRENRRPDLESLQKILREKRSMLSSLRKEAHSASLDSEISLVRNNDYPLEGWVLNPFFLGFHENGIGLLKEPVLFVSRLDGPFPEIVKRIVDDSFSAEKNCLRGNACFDARFAESSKTELSGIASFDQSLHRAAAIVRMSGVAGVTFDQRNTLFERGQCPDTALYCGWYSLARYIDAFSWVPGVIGFHAASSECHSLKKDREYWCKRMLEEGAAAVVGPVAEPYIQAFPLPDVFFGLLVQGELT